MEGRRPTTTPARAAAAVAAPVTAKKHAMPIMSTQGRNPIRERRTCRATPNDSDDASPSGWTPFSLPEAEPSTRPRVQRMVETRRGDPYVEEARGDGHGHGDGDTAVGATAVGEDDEDARCSQCSGTGRQVCEYCMGLGRTNYKSKVMLPKGVWPTWCTKCIRCSGETVCGVCLGSGKKRCVLISTDVRSLLARRSSLVAPRSSLFSLRTPRLSHALPASCPPPK